MMPIYIRRRLLIALAVVPLLAALLISAASQSATAATSTVTPSDDSYVRADQTGTNFGTATSIQAKASVSYNGYLKFAVPAGFGTVTKATFQLMSRSTGTTPLKVLQVADTGWTEGSITYANAPAIGALIGSSGALTPGSPITVDVSSYVTGPGTYSFAITSTATAARLFDSKEGATAPQLILESSASTSSTPTSTSTTTTTATSTTATSTAPTSTTATSTTATSTTATSTTATSTAPPSNDPVLAVAGDVACATTESGYNGGAGTPGHCHERATAALIGAMKPAAVLMLGDGQYNSGSLSEYKASYGTTWGTYKSITKPTVGNHEYGSPGASGFWNYFGSIATPLQPSCRSKCNGWYSFDIGAWHIVNINAECTQTGGGAGCATGSAQEVWLKKDLAASTATCTLVMGHRPRWSSNSFASADIAPLISDMYAAGVDLYLSGHSHAYERFAPQNPSGAADAAKGIRQIVIGTGGEFFTGMGTAAANSQLRKTNIFGVGKLTLHPTSYDLSFVADPSTPFTDTTSGTCH